QNQLNAVNDQIDAAGGRASAALTSRQATLQSTVNTLTSSIASAQPTNSGASATVVEPGTDPIASGKGKLRSVAPFALAALLAGVLLAVVLARLSGRVLDAEEVEEILGVPVHGRMPKEMDTSVRHGWWNVPPDTAAFLEELCTRVESCERRGRG